MQSQASMFVTLHGAQGSGWEDRLHPGRALSPGLAHPFLVCEGKSVSCSCVSSSSNLGNESFNLESVRCAIPRGSGFVVVN